MKRAGFSTQAAADVEEIATFIAQDNLDAALRFYDRIDLLRQRLARSPLLGRERPDLAPGLRSYPLGNYLVFYLLTPKGVVVVRVLSGFRDVAPGLFDSGQLDS